MTVYMGGIGVLDGMYWVMMSLVAMEINHQNSDITFTLLLFATACGYLVGPPAIGKFLQTIVVVHVGVTLLEIFNFSKVSGIIKVRFFKNP